MLSFIKNLFGAKPSQVEAEAPYKVEALPAGTEASIVAGAGTETMVVIVPDAVAPAAVVEAAPAKKPAKPKATPKPKAVPKPKAPAKPKAPKVS